MEANANISIIISKKESTDIKKLVWTTAKQESAAENSVTKKAWHKPAAWGEILLYTRFTKHLHEIDGVINKISDVINKIRDVAKYQPSDLLYGLYLL